MTQPDGTPGIDPQLNPPMPEAKLPASENFDKLKQKLAELFELDKADLDFGIYRILRQRHAEITDFLDRHLEKTVREALDSHATTQRAQLENDLRAAEAAAAAAGIPPEASPRVTQLRQQLKSTEHALIETADEVYSHLLTFFSRYYQDGDFLGLQRSTVHGKEKYVIPYNGEELKMVWANMDQYYIKSSELLRDYTFHVRAPAGPLFVDADQQFTVQFKLVEGDTEKDNRKGDSANSRIFVLDRELPFQETSPVSLQMRFHYREEPAQRNLQDKVNLVTEQTLLSDLPETWRMLLATPATSGAGKKAKDDQSLLTKHLTAYTARHQFDYFIHKDLGGFLRRELDFYIKNELMHLDDIEDVSAPKAEQYLSKIRAVRRCASPIIRMLAQLEDFQKRLWLKKKFVVETRYCITVDRVPRELYPAVCDNPAQWEEWEQLYSLSGIPVDLYSAPLRTVTFLEQHPYLVLDTGHFDRPFLTALLKGIQDLDGAISGICFHSENFQALELLQNRYREAVKCVYIDPPYNTSSSSIPYKNNYRHSSWGTLMFDRLELLRNTLAKDGAIFVSIDKLERTLLETTMDMVFGSENKIEELIWSMNTNNSQAPNYSTNHEYVEVYAKDRSVAEQDRNMFREPKPGYEEVASLIAGLNLRYPPIAEIETGLQRLYREHEIEYREAVETLGLEWDDEKSNDPWKGLFNYNRAEYRDSDGKLMPESDAQARQGRIWVWREADSSMPATKQAPSTRNPGHANWRFYTPLHPRTGKPCPHPKSGWKFAFDDDSDSPEKRSFVALDRDDRIAWGTDERKVPQLKRMLHEVETNVGKSVFQDYSDGEKQTSALFGRSGVFLAPKHASFVSRFILHSGRKDSIILDCFGGSGSTAHAVISLNREDRGSRKYVLAEMGDHFETVIVPRLKKAAYAEGWRGGKPIDHTSGISHAFKIVRLESYEDTLNNLHVRRTHEQEKSLRMQDHSQADEYMLGYFLDAETAGSPSVLDVAQFRDPFSYKLQIATRSAGETKPTTVDLVETFNWLIGLKVKHIDHEWGFVTVTGENRDGERIFIVWRTLSDDHAADNARLDRFFEKLVVNPADTEYHDIYVNGSHTLSDPHNKIRLIEEEFQRRMFESDSIGSLE